MNSMYFNLIMKAKYFEECLKASSELDIPLVIVDKAYYFNKMLSESKAYDDKTKNSISEMYLQSDELKKKEIFNSVVKGLNLTQHTQPKDNTTNTR